MSDRFIGENIWFLEAESALNNAPILQGTYRNLYFDCIFKNVNDDMRHNSSGQCERIANDCAYKSTIELVKKYGDTREMKKVDKNQLLYQQSNYPPNYNFPDLK